MALDKLLKIAYISSTYTYGWHIDSIFLICFLLSPNYTISCIHHGNFFAVKEANLGWTIRKRRPTLSEQGEEPNLAVTLGEQGGQPYVNKEANPGCAVHPWLAWGRLCLIRKKNVHIFATQLFHWPILIMPF